MHHILLRLFFFVSGASSLVFEVIWERQLMKVFGATSLAIGTLLTAFMAGLALGATLGGRWAQRSARPLRVYGLLEAGVGLYALALPFLFKHLPDLYRALPVSLREDFYAFALVRFVMVFLLLLLPTTLMGATLPMVSQWIARGGAKLTGQVGLLYGINTMGACLGCFGAGFVLLPALGITATNNLFAGLNLLLCAAVLAVEARAHRAPAPVVEAPDEELDEEIKALRPAVVVAALPGWARGVALGVVVMAGAISMSYQVLWTRAYVIVLGSSTYSFTIILVSFLIGLSCGSALISSVMHRIGRPLWWLACAQLGAGLFASQTFVTLDQLPEVLFWRMRGAQTVASVYMDYFLLVGLVVFLPTFLQGMTFPLAVRALVPADAGEGLGRAVGRLYALNTLGSIVGSFVAGFVLMPMLGLSAGVSLVIGLNLVAGGALAVCALRVQPERRGAAIVAALGAVIVATLVLAPPVDRVKLTRGMFRAAWARELFNAKTLERDRPELVFYEDGMGATISVERRGERVVLKSNGKAEASDGADMATQILVGLLPFVMRSAQPDAVIGQEVSAMVGYGSGVTAGGSLQWPLKELEVVEIEAAMAPASRFFDHVNHRPMEDARTRLVVADGRNYLEFATRQYDAIVSEPSNPWIAGVAALFTVEHFRRARRHLKPGGVFSQWVQLYEMDPENVRMILATFAQVFPHVIAFSSMPKGTDLILLGADHPLVLPQDGFARAWAIGSVRAELERAGIKTPYDIYGLMFMNEAELRAFAASADVLNTDDNGALEFRTPRDIIRYEEGQRYFTERYHEQALYGDVRPHLGGWGGWSAEQVCALARGAWVAGKRAYADELFAAAPPDGRGAACAAFKAVQTAQQADLRRQTLLMWPVRQGPLSVMIDDTMRHSKETQAMQALEAEQPPGKDGYTGERGLFYAHLLMTRGYYKLALKQLDGLRARPEDRAMVESVPFALMEGFVLQKRLRYQEAWVAWQRAGEGLASAR
jgi:spermidine synthase